MATKTVKQFVQNLFKSPEEKRLALRARVDNWLDEFDKKLGISDGFAGASAEKTEAGKKLSEMIRNVARLAYMEGINDELDNNLIFLKIITVLVGIGALVLALMGIIL